VIVFYIAVQSFRVSQSVIKSGFALFAVFLLIVILGNLASPAIFNFFNVDYHLYDYIHLVSMLPLIGAIIIFNSVANARKLLLILAKNHRLRMIYFNDTSMLM
jgi:hypothetical protein